MPSGPGFVGLGALILDPNVAQDTTDDLRKREIRAKVYRQMQPKHMVKAPLTKAMFSRKGKPIGNNRFEWPRRREISQWGTVAGIYEDPGFAQEYDNAVAPADAAEGATVYVEVPASVAADIQPLETFKIHGVAEQNGLVLDAVEIDYGNANAAPGNAVIRATLMHADNAARGNVLGSDKAGGNTVIHPLSMAMPELSMLPDGYTEEATLEFNYAQIFSEAFSLSGSKVSDENAFDEDNYKESLRQAHDRFMQQFEWAATFGVRRESTAPVSVVAHGQQKQGRRWFTGGVVSALEANQFPDGTSNYIRINRTAAFEGQDFTGDTWNQGAYDFLKRLMLRLSRWSGNDKQVYMSSAAMQDVLDVFESMSNVMISTDHKDAWGFDVTRIKGLNCTLNLHQHRMFNVIPAYSRAMLIVEPKLISWRPKRGRDITFIDSKGARALAQRGGNDGWTWRDGVKEGWIADGGIQYDNLEAMAYVDGVGQDFFA